MVFRGVGDDRYGILKTGDRNVYTSWRGWRLVKDEVREISIRREGAVEDYDGNEDKSWEEVAAHGWKIYHVIVQIFDIQSVLNQDLMKKVGYFKVLIIFVRRPRIF